MLRSQRTRSTSRRQSRLAKSLTGRKRSIARFEQLEPRTMLTTNPTLSIPTTTIAARSSIVAVPIYVNQLTDNVGGSLTTNINDINPAHFVYVNCTRIGLSSADFAVNFDPSEFSVSKSDVRLGTILTNVVASTPLSLQPNATSATVGWLITVNQSLTHPGQLSIHIAAANPYAVITSPQTGSPLALGSVPGTDPLPVPGRALDSLVVIDFHVKATAAVGKTAINLAASNAVSLKPTAMFDATGRQYVLNSAPTNASTDKSDGAVTVISTPPAVGTWTAVTVPATVPPITTEGLGTMLLLADGSVIAQAGFDQPSADWFRLTPDATGSYATGTWSQIAPMPDLFTFTPEDLTHNPIVPTPQGGGRLFYGSVVLQDGRVLILGGEFTSTSFGQGEDPTGVIYDPVANTWTQIASFPQPLFNQTTGSFLTQNPSPPQTFGDSQLELMSDGSVLAQFLGYKFGTTESPAFRYYPAQDQWVEDATLLNGDRGNEENWLKLGDGSILANENWGTNPGEAERLVFGATPADDRWVDAGHIPVNLETNNSAFAEQGGATLLPDGRALVLGATGNSAIYTPPSAGNPKGSWAIGPVFPGGLGVNDAPLAALPNGRILISASSTPNFSTPLGASLFEYDPVTNTLNKITNLPAALATSLSGLDAFNCRTLVLPSGQVLFNDSTGQPYLYTPAGGPNDAWRPTITDISQTDVTSAGDPIYTLTGTQLNGLSEGANYGDDVQSATNYPIIQLIGQTGVVTYATTFNWSSAWVQTGSTPESVEFTLPTGTTINDFVSLKVIANGIASLPTNQVIVLGTAGQEDITIQVSPANPNLVQIFSGGTLISQHPNNQTSGKIIIQGDANNNSVTIDETNGIVNVPVDFDGGGFATFPPGDSMSIVGTGGTDNIVVTPTSDTSASITDNGLAPYTFKNISVLSIDGSAGTNAVAVVDTLGKASMNETDTVVTYNGGTPIALTNVDTLALRDASAVGGDAFNVLSTTIPTTVGSTTGAGGDTINIGSDAPVNQFGDLSGINAAVTVATGAGKNTLVVCDGGSFTAGLTFTLTNNQIAATDLPVNIAYSQTAAGNLNLVLDGSQSVPTTFTVTSTLGAGNSVVLSGGEVDGNAFNIGSTFADDNGVLSKLPAAITVNGGAVGTTNTLEIDDHGSVGAYNYIVGPSSVQYDIPSSPTPAKFGGVTYVGIQSLQLDATDQPNFITVAPSFTTVMTINGNDQGSGADSLQINTANVSGPVTNNPSGGPVSFDGFFSFEDGHQNVNYTNIENFPAPAPLVSFPILAYSSDAGTTSLPIVKIVNAQTGDLVTSFSPVGYAANYTGGLNVAVGYFDGTGQPEVAVAPGRNHSPTIQIYDAFGNLLYSFQAYAANFTGGVAISAGNVEHLFSGGHEIDDIVTAPTRGVSDIRVFSNKVLTNPTTPFSNTPFREFTAWGTNFLGGSTVAVADLNADGRGDIIVGSGPGIAPLIEAFDVTFSKTSYTPFKTFAPFASTFRGGVNVSAVNTQPNSDITAPMIVASQASAGTGQLTVLNGSTGAVQYTTNLGGTAGVRTAARIVSGRFYVFASKPVSSPPSKISKIDPLSASAVDFLFETDPAFNRMNLG